MKRKRFSEERSLRSYASTRPCVATADLCRKHFDRRRTVEEESPRAATPAIAGAKLGHAGGRGSLSRWKTTHTDEANDQLGPIIAPSQRYDRRPIPVPVLCRPLTTGNAGTGYPAITLCSIRPRCSANA